jgi:hypothetical protein
MATEFKNPDLRQDPPPFPGRDMNSDSERGATQAVKKEVGEMLDGAKEGARSTLNQTKDTAAAGMDDVAAALRDASQRRQDQGDDTFARLAGSAADGLERFSGTLRNKDVGTMLRDVNAFAHRQPVAFFGLALAAGVLATRFIKAGHD